MAGYSKWSKVKHIKGPLDFKRGAAFSKLVKEITVAARLGDGDLSGNPRLRSVEDCDDTQNVYSNFDIPEATLARLAA